MKGKPIIYALKSCPACIKLKEDWLARGQEFEERLVDEKQTWLNEALKYGDLVPIVVYEDGQVEIGYANMISCCIA